MRTQCGQPREVVPEQVVPAEELRPTHGIRERVDRAAFVPAVDADLTVAEYHAGISQAAVQTDLEVEECDRRQELARATHHGLEPSGTQMTLAVGAGAPYRYPPRSEPLRNSDPPR